ncbi:MAG: lysylphosphatidylglycerol synthase domain-containing protein [Bacteroidota bacterium]
MYRRINIRKNWRLLLKIGVFLLALYLLFRQLEKIEWNTVKHVEILSYSYLLYAVVLVLLNWGLELFKWFIIVRSFERESNFGRIRASLLAGIATGFVTPNRLGNFIGRIGFFKGKKRLMLSLGTLYGNLAQFLSTFFFGVIGVFYLGHVFFELQVDQTIQNFGWFLGGISLLLYLFLPVISFERWRWFRKWRHVLTDFRQKLRKISFVLLLLSTIRYLVFVLQFVLILVAFGVSYTHELSYAIFVHYLVTTMVPTAFFGKIVVRETSALMILGFLVSNSALIIFASLTLWLINVVLPALVGFYYFMQNKHQQNG